MENKEILNEEKYQKIKKGLVLIGCISLVIGVGLFISSFFIQVPDMNQEGWFEATRTQSLLRFLAFPFGLMIPLMTFTIAFRREMLAFQTQQVMPVAQEGIEKMTPTVGNAAGEIAKGVTKGIKEGLKDQDNTK